jgi:hypothetical protein
MKQLPLLPFRAEVSITTTIFDSVKSWLQIIASILTILAIISTALWFFLKKEHKPHLNIKQQIGHVATKNDFHILTVAVSFENPGKTEAVIQKGHINVLQITPLLGCDENDNCASRQISKELKGQQQITDTFKWHYIANRNIYYEKPMSIYPGETDSSYFEFAIPLNVEVVKVNCEIFKDDKNKMVWSTSNYYSFASK